MKLLFNDFFYSYLIYYITNVRSCAYIGLVPPGSNAYSKGIWYFISSVSRNGNVIYLIGYPLTCNGTADFSYNPSSPPAIDMTLCSTCGQYTNYFGLQDGVIAIVNQKVPALSTTLYMRITLPPDIT